MNYALFFDDQIQVQNKNIHGIWLRIALLIGIGLALSGLSYLIETAKIALPDVIKIGPTLVGASISIFTGKDISTSRERIATYKFLKQNLAQIDTATPEEREMFFKTVAELWKESAAR